MTPTTKLGPRDGNPNRPGVIPTNLIVSIHMTDCTPIVGQANLVLEALLDEAVITVTRAILRDGSLTTDECGDLQDKLFEAIFLLEGLSAEIQRGEVANA